MPVLGEVYPARLSGTVAVDRAGKQPAHTPQQRLQSMLDRGLAAQLRTANLLTGHAYIALDFFPKGSPSKVVKKAGPPGAEASAPGTLIELPTIPGGSDEIQAHIAEITRSSAKSRSIKLAMICGNHCTLSQHTLDSAGRLAERLNNDVAPEIAGAMKDARKSLGAVERTLAEDAPLQQDLREALQELGRAAASLRVLTDYLERHPEVIIQGKREDKH